jgi:hypothetical protein
MPHNYLAYTGVRSTSQTNYKTPASQGSKKSHRKFYKMRKGFTATMTTPISAHNLHNLQKHLQSQDMQYEL